MTFEENVNKLIKKYDAEHGLVYDEMTYTTLKLMFIRPKDYAFNKEVFDRKTYLIANQHLSEKYLQNNTHQLESISSKNYKK